MKEPFKYDPNADIEERAQIYLGRHEGTGLFTNGILLWLRDNEAWMQSSAPSDEEVREQLKGFIERSIPWTATPNDADCWSGYWIDRYQRFLPEINWHKAVLRTEPLNK